jgi:hypothetical protein
VPRALGQATLLGVDRNDRQHHSVTRRQASSRYGRQSSFPELGRIRRDIGARLRIEHEVTI